MFLVLLINEAYQKINNTYITKLHQNMDGRMIIIMIMITIIMCLKRVGVELMIYINFNNN